MFARPRGLRIRRAPRLVVGVRAEPVPTCGFAPRDNEVLKEHWRAAGFVVVDCRGTLQVRPVGETEVAADERA